MTIYSGSYNAVRTNFANQQYTAIGTVTLSTSINSNGFVSGTGTLSGSVNGFDLLNYQFSDAGTVTQALSGGIGNPHLLQVFDVNPFFIGSSGLIDFGGDFNSARTQVAGQVSIIDGNFSGFAEWDITFTLNAQGPVTVTAASDGTVPSFDHTTSLALDLTSVKAGQSITGLTGNDTITVGLAGISLSATSGSDQITIPAGTTGTSSLTFIAGSHTVTAAAGTNTFIGGSGSELLSITGGSNTAYTGSGTHTISITGGSSTVIANQGSATISDNVTGMLLGELGGTQQVTLSGGAPAVIATAGASTITATASAPLIGLFGGTHQITTGSGGATLFSLGATTTVTGGSGITGVDLVSGKMQIVAGSGTVELFDNGGTNTLVEQSGSGLVLVSGYTQATLAINIPHAINGNNFTAASQIAITHNAAGDTFLNLGAPGNAGAQLVWLVGTASISSSAITLV